MNLKVAFMTLGCKVNQFETDTMAGLFRQAGHEIVPFEEKADAYIVNTCAVTNLSERKSRQMLRRARRENPQAVVTAVGCYAQTQTAEVARLGIDVVVGADRRREIVTLVQNAAEQGKRQCAVDDWRNLAAFEDIPLTATTTRTRAFLKIEDGCENFCSYCLIPYARGKIRSRSLASIRRETARFCEMGFAEIVLTGIHLGAYGRDLENGATLADACREVLRDNRVKRLRLSSLETAELGDDLLELMQNEPRFCRHLHLPLQAGTDDILRLMNRHYTTADFANLTEKVRQKIDDVAISTDIIVGFPTETDELFTAGLRFAEQMHFSRIHVFPYSSRKGTRAAAMAEQVPSRKKKERAQRMQEAAKKSAAEFAANFIGRTMPVLFETYAEGHTDGLTSNYLRIYVEEEIKSGTILPVTPTAIYRDGLKGTPIT